MKLKSCLIIRCIALNTINKQEYLYKLKIYIKEHFPHATINLTINEPYWKEPESDEIIHQLFNDEFITVTEFIKYLLLSWHQKKINYEEDAVWSKLCHPEETFLMPEIEWVQIYTWKKDEELIIN
ncbi:MAG TPA: hypothetical protein VLB80_01550 [Candidatus Babeliales bacterium]|nr:hypothetical protein [Candidatus Babeliales bacterium]